MILRFLVVYLWIFFLVIIDALIDVKASIVRRMFWGRGGLYRTSFHIIISAITLTLLISNFAGRISVLQFVEAENDLQVSYASVGNSDVLQQGESLNSIVAIDPGIPEFNVYQYVVQKGDTLKDIADDFDVSKDTIKWANSNTLSPFNDDLTVGMKLNIPEMNGVLYTVQKGDSLDRIVALTQGDKASIIELNRLIKTSGDNYKLDANQRLFVPDGKLKPPEPPKTTRSYTYSAAPASNNVEFQVAKKALDGMPSGTFGNPLARCPGYRYQRGLTAYHHGADFSRGGGCPVVAAAAGKVHYVGYHSLSGFHVILDHGSGIRTHYFHAKAGTFKVSQGQQVSKGQELFYMGCTGRCTGTHLHFELLAGKGGYLNPLNYVKM